MSINTSHKAALSHFVIFTQRSMGEAVIAEHKHHAGALGMLQVTCVHGGAPEKR
jgi:hypothetical protein